MVGFKPTGDADPSKVLGLASPPTGKVVGELSTTIGGTPVILSISIR